MATLNRAYLSTTLVIFILLIATIVLQYRLLTKSSARMFTFNISIDSSLEKAAYACGAIFLLAAMLLYVLLIASSTIENPTLHYVSYKANWNLAFWCLCCGILCIMSFRGGRTGYLLPCLLVCCAYIIEQVVFCVVEALFNGSRMFYINNLCPSGLQNDYCKLKNLRSEFLYHFFENFIALFVGFLSVICMLVVTTIMISFKFTAADSQLTEINSSNHDASANSNSSTDNNTNRSNSVNVSISANESNTGNIIGYRKRCQQGILAIGVAGLVLVAAPQLTGSIDSYYTRHAEAKMYLALQTLSELIEPLMQIFLSQVVLDRPLVSGTLMIFSIARLNVMYLYIMWWMQWSADHESLMEVLQFMLAIAFDFATVCLCPMVNNTDLLISDDVPDLNDTTNDKKEEA